MAVIHHLVVKIISPSPSFQVGVIGWKGDVCEICLNTPSIDEIETFFLHEYGIILSEITWKKEVADTYLVTFSSKYNELLESILT